MHHEVLLAAVGCPGDIIRPTGHGGASSSSLYAVAPGVSFLSPGTCSLAGADVCMYRSVCAYVCGSVGVSASSTSVLSLCLRV